MSRRPSSATKRQAARTLDALERAGYVCERCASPASPAAPLFPHERPSPQPPEVACTGCRPMPQRAIPYRLQPKASQ